MKNKYYTIAVLLSLFTLPLQAADDTPIMQYWKGGTMNLGINAYMSHSAGIGGGILSPVFSSGAENVNLNPAVISLTDKAQFLLDGKFGLSNNTFGLGAKDIISEDDMEEMTDDFLEDTATFKFPQSNFKQYTSFEDLDASATGGFTSIAFTIPVVKSLTIGASFSPVVNLSLNMFVNGISTNLKTIKEVGSTETSIDMIMKPTIAADVSLKMNKSSFAVGYSFLNEKKGKLALGLAFNRYQVRNYIDFNLNIDGMIVLSNGPEYYFNDLNDQNLNFDEGETNKLFMKAKGNFKSNKWGYTIGAFFDPSGLVKGLSFFNISMAVDIVPEFNLSDNTAKLESFQPKFFTGKFNGEDDEQLDIIIDSLDLAKPNLTKRTNNPFTQNIVMNLPSSFTTGLDFRLGKHTLTLNYVKYFGELSYKFDKYKIGKKPDSGIKFGADFRMPNELKGWNWALLPVRLLYLDIDGLLFQAFRKHTGYTNSHYRFGGGIMIGDAIVEGFPDDDAESMKDAFGIPMPTTFTLSRQYTVYEKFNFGVMVFGFPDMLMKFSLGYSI